MTITTALGLLQAKPAVAPQSDAGAIEHAIAQWINSLRWDDLPASVVSVTKTFILDTLGVIGAAAQAPGLAELRVALETLEPGNLGLATDLISGVRLSPGSAALANGAAAHALDFDDQHDQARVHAFCVVLPAALAASEQIGGVNGRRFITAIAAGVELFCRLGLTCRNSLGKGWHPTTALGSIAAAATVSKLLNLDVAETTHAMGFGFVQLSGTTQFIADGVLAKRIGPGFAARNGVVAGYFALAGLTAPWRFLTGDAGLFQLHERGEVDVPTLLSGLGSTWHLTDLSIKPFPCCRCNHTVIQLALEARRDGLKIGDIDSGLIAVGRTNLKIVGAPFRPEVAINTVVHAQFNACYSFVCALIDGYVDLRSYEPVVIGSPNMGAARRFTVVEADDIEPTDIVPARVQLTLRDGRTVSYSANLMPGSPQSPLSSDEVSTKFTTCLQSGLKAEASKILELNRTIMSLETLSDVTRLAEGFPRRKV